MCAHPVGYIDEALLHDPRTIPSTRVTYSSVNWVEPCRGLCVRLLSVRRFGEDSTDRCLGFVRFSQRIRLNGPDIPHACILFGIDLQCHG